MTTDKATPVPQVRGPRVNILSPSGFAFWLARSGVRYFVTGKEIAGPGDNATFLHDATVDYRGRPYEKLTRARWRRVARRWALVGVPGGLCLGEVSSDLIGGMYGAIGVTPPEWTDVPWGELLAAYAVTGPAAAGVILVPRAVEHWKEREPRRDFIYPAAKVLGSILGQKIRKRDALMMINLPPRFGEELEDGAQPGSVRIYLPPVPLDPGTKKRVEANVGARLGMPNPVATWQEAGGRAFVDLMPAALPPARLTYADVKDAIEEATLERPLVGMANGRVLHYADLDNESPHVGVSGGSGAGKSTALRLILAQRLRHGTGLITLDFKKWSHDWAHGLPANRVIYRHEVDEIHEACVAIGDELIRRKSLATREELDAQRTIDVLVEEVNSLIPLLRAYWTQMKAEIKWANKAALQDDPHADVTEPPVASPAILALEMLINMGREFHMHAWYAGQRLSAGVFGANGGDKRSSFQTILLGKWDKNSWKMLAGGVPFVVCPGGPRGIWALVQGGESTVLRVPFLTVHEARTLALSGPEPASPVLPGYGHPGPVLDMSTDKVSVEDRRVRLSEAVSLLPGQRTTVNALRMAVKQDQAFPEPLERGGPGRADLYSLAALTAWKERRDAGHRELG